MLGKRHNDKMSGVLPTKCWVCQEGQNFFLFAQKLRRPGIEPGTLNSSLDLAHSSALTASATSAG